jgi:phage-related protein
LPSRINNDTIRPVDEAKRVPARFYATLQGNEPVREWLKSLEPSARRRIGFDLKELEYGWPVGMPLSRSLGHGLWELRSNLPDGRIARVIFCVQEAELVLLHGFVKKTQKTPPQAIELAWGRMKGMRR